MPGKSGQLVTLARASFIASCLAKYSIALEGKSLGKQESLRWDSVTYWESSPGRIDRMAGGLGNLRGEPVFCSFFSNVQKAASGPEIERKKFCLCALFPLRNWN